MKFPSKEVNKSQKQPPLFQSVNCRSSNLGKDLHEIKYLHELLQRKSIEISQKTMDSVKLATCGNQISIWNLPELSTVYEYSKDSGKVTSASWNHDGTCLAR